jgi:hypothetical protein
MHAVLSFAYITCLLLCLTQQSLSQIGLTKEELVRRYGTCLPNAIGTSEESNAYHSVIDVKEDCTFHFDQLIIMSKFKAGKAVAFDYGAQSAFMDSALVGRNERYRKLWDLEILRLLWISLPGAEWVNMPSNSTILRWRTKDHRAFAYYFADGDYKRHELLVQTAAVDAVFKKTDKVIRGLRPN